MNVRRTTRCDSWSEAGRGKCGEGGPTGNEPADRHADRERARADQERSRADAVGVELQRAREEAEAMRKADADRKARGRLARLRAAWRRE